ncbi:MAG: heparin lyase I family protein [Cyclobacteriaceae bacterium]
MSMDTVAMPGRSNKTKIRNRAEVFIKPKHPANSKYYYSWKFMVPNNAEEFVDDEESDRHGYHIIGQWHEEDHIKPICKKPHPPITLTYKHSKDTSGYRNLGLTYGLKCQDENAKILNNKEFYKIINPIKKGDWVKIVFGIYWSSESEGYLQVWVNDSPVIFEGQKGTMRSGDILPTKLHGANMYTRASDSRAIPNYLKLGHYRSRHTYPSTIYFDDFGITTEYPNG